MQSEILNKVRNIILASISIEIDREKIVPETSLRDDLQADSLVRVKIVMALEDAFKIQLNEELGRSLVR